jgi:hypothetical protein
MRTRFALIVAAALMALAPLPSWVIERFYSNGLYRGIQPALTTTSNFVPFALFDVLIAGVTVGWLGLAARDISRRGTLWPFRVFGSIAARSIVWAAVLYLAFLAGWGLNYRRVGLVDRLRFDGAAVDTDSLRRLALEALEQVNTLHGPAHAAGWPPAHRVDPDLAAAFARANGEINRRAGIVLARPKTTLLDWYFRRASVDGMTDPYFLETLVSDDLLPFERPFVIAHEWSHLAGLADEGEANFLGWLTCVHGSTAHQYSGWLFLYQHIVAALPRRDRLELQPRLEPGPRADLRAVADRIARSISPRVAVAGWRVYDRYLKANRVEAGAQSYAEVVRLILGVRFGPDWTPTQSGS